MFFYTFLNYGSFGYSSDHARNRQISDGYVQIGLQQATKYTSSDTTKAAHLRVRHNLENTMCDSLQSLKWRIRCFEQLKNLWPLICELISSREYERYWWRIQTLHAYFVRPAHKDISGGCCTVSSKTDLRNRRAK